MSRFTQDELKHFDKTSIDNMLAFYEEEMLRIDRGERPQSFLTRPMLNRFVKIGILERGLKGKRWRLTLSRKGREWYGLPPRSSLPSHRK